MRGRLGLALAALLTSASAGAFTPPPLTEQVTDTTGTLRAEDVPELAARLRLFRTETGFAIVVLLANLPEGENIDDAAYQTFNAWKVGAKGEDNGVLLMIAPNVRKIRIETGKGTGGQLTDLQANEIINRDIKPALRANDYRAGVLAGTDAIAHALAPEHPLAAAARREPPRDRVSEVPPARGFGQQAGGLCCTLLIVGIILFFRFRSGFGFWGGGGGGFGGWGGGGGFGGGGGSGGGGGYSGGGGESGGGGSSDSY